MDPDVRNFTDRKVAHSYATRRLMPFPHPILGHSNAIHILTLFPYDAHKKYDPPIYMQTAAHRETGTWQAVTGIFDQHTHTQRFLRFFIILRLVTTVQSSFACAPWFQP